MITVATLLWDANAESYDFSSMYTEEWVEKLYRQFARNLTVPFEFVCFTDRQREFFEPIKQERITAPLNYGCCIEPYKLNKPMILLGLDTMIIGNIDHLAEYCLTSDKIAVPRDPFYPDTVCNGVQLVPAGFREVWDTWNGENDMEYIRSRRDRLNVIDDLWPGQVISYKGEVMGRRVPLDTRIVYFHGAWKMHELGHEPFVREHWV